MKKKYVLPGCGILALFAGTILADPYRLPLNVDYSLIKNALKSELYTGAGQTANLWNDLNGCSFLKLSDPRIDGQKGQIRLLNQVQARVGTGMGGQCITVLDWSGVLETWQKPTLDDTRSVLNFPVTQAIAHDRQGRRLAIGQLQDLINRFAAPRLGSLKVDLKQSRKAIERNLAYFLPKENEAEIRGALNTLKFSRVEALEDGISVQFTFDAPAKPAAGKPSAPFTEAERKQWQAVWQPWDDFLGAAIQQATRDTDSQALRDTLMEILLESRLAFQAGLSDQNPGSEDPVRVFFIQTWERLAPELKTLARQLPEIQGLRYLTFIAATDVIYELENLGRPFGLELSSDGLRKLGRMLIEGRRELPQHGQT
ncbi:MAG: hypothetical protein ACU841_13955 [Gammaproteobacteria bacterium]